MEEEVEGRRRARWDGDEAAGGRRGLECDEDAASGADIAGAAAVREAVRLQCPARLCKDPSSE